MKDVPVDPVLLIAIAKLRRKLKTRPEVILERAIRVMLVAHGIENHSVSNPSQPKRRKK